VFPNNERIFYPLQLWAVPFKPVLLGARGIYHPDEKARRLYL